MVKHRVSAEAIDRAILGLQSMARTMIDLEPALRSALGFTETIHHRGITFLISERFVIADLRPLAFLGLLEEVEQDVTLSIGRLYDRILPLLRCQHEWTLDNHLLKDGLADDTRPMPHSHVCRLCTAYAVSSMLPRVGRGFEMPM